MAGPFLSHTRRKQLQKVNLANPAFKADPFSFCEELRANAPVFQTWLPTRQKIWLVARYDDVLTVYKDERFAKDPRAAMTEHQQARQPWIPAFLRPMMRSMQSADGEAHARLRGLVQQAFSPRMLEALPEHVERIANRLLDRKQSQGRMDVVEDFALPLPLTLLSEMLGIPEHQRSRFHRYVHGFFRTPSQPRVLQVLKVPATLTRMYFWIGELRQLLAERRAAPRNDLISAIAEAENQGDRLDADECLAMLASLLAAGYETTANLIAGGALSLLENRDQLELLESDPDAHIKPAIEECLRYVTPADASPLWYAREDIALAGTVIPRGEIVSALLISANFDETQFKEPRRMDITRHPNKHIALGAGRHHCLGSTMARIQGQVAIKTLLRRCGELRFETPSGPPAWRHVLGFRGPASLPVVFR